MFGGLGLGAPPVPSPPDSQTGGAMTTYKTTRGIEIEITSVPMMLIDKINAAHKDPEPPTYAIELPLYKDATGQPKLEYHPLDDQTAETDEEKAALADWKKRKAEAETERNRAFMRVVMLRGIKVQMPTDDAWITEQRLMGLDVPDDPTERRLHFIETEVFGGRADYEEITRLVMIESGVDMEAVRQASELFRGDMARATIEQPANPGGQVDIQH